MAITRVLIVDDSPLVAQILEAVLEEDKDIEVLGVAKNGQEALEMATRLKPDIITMDVVMPVMDGVESTKQIMAYVPTPILILSSSVFVKRMDQVFKAMAYGALDVMDKKAFESYGVDEKMKTELIKRVKFLSKVKVINHPMARLEKLSFVASARKAADLMVTREDMIVGIAASVGGTEALRIILKDLPKDFPAPVVVVQHMAPGFIEGFADWLAHNTSMNVRIAKKDDSLNIGTVYVAPDAYQMKVTADHKIALVDEPLVDGQKPSGSVLLSSVASVYGKNAIGVILTGMGRDGAAGIEDIFNNKGHTIAQNETTSVVYGMPKAAVDKNVVHELLSLEKIAEALLKWIKK